MPGDCCRVSMTWVSSRSSTSWRPELRPPSRTESRTESRTYSRTKRAPLDGGVPRENLGVHVAENHLRGNGVVPREQAPPHRDLVFQQRSKVGGSEVSEIEDFHRQ